MSVGNPGQMISRREAEEEREDHPFLVIDHEKPDVKVREIGENSIVLEWKTSSIERNRFDVTLEDLLTGVKRVQRTTASECTILDLIKGRNYKVNVRALPGEYSDDLIVSVGPSAPQNVIARNSDLFPSKSITVAFEDPDSTPKFYRVIAKRTGAASGQEVEIDKSYYTFNDLEPGRAYEISVEAIVESQGIRLFSRKSYPSSEIITYPDQVTVDEPKYHEDGTATVTWEAVKGASDYFVEWTDGEQVFSKVATGIAVLLKNLRQGKTYILTVAARNTAGVALASEPLFLKSSLEAPTSLSVQKSVYSPHDTIIVQFDYPPSTGVAFIAVAQSLENQDHRREFETYATSAILNKLLPGETYQVCVEARRGSLKSTRIVCPALMRMCIPTPANVIAKQNTGSPCNAFDVQFDFPDIKGIKFRVVATSISSPATTAKEVETRCAIIDGLVPGCSYSIYVIALHKPNEETFESEKAYHQGVLQTYPPEPLDVKVDIDRNTLEIKWAKLQIPPKNYKVIIGVEGEKIEAETDREIFALDNIKPSSTFRVRVAAVNDAGCGPFSKEVFAYSDPAPPTNPRFERNRANPQRSFLVSYDDLDLSFKLYKITAMPSSGDESKKVEMTTTEKSVAICGLTPGHSYRVFVVALMDGPEKGKHRQSKRVYCLPAGE